MTLKSMLSPLAMTLLIVVATGSASAAQIGVPDRVDPTPQWGTWRATARFINPHANPDGSVSTYTYVHITASTYESCQQQLSNYRSVVEWCWLDSN